MPTNLPTEWYIIEEEYRKEKGEKKIELLRKLISVTPKHKGTEKLLADLRKKLSKLEKEMEKRSRKIVSTQSIKKTGDILVAILGPTKSGKSTLLKELTNASVEISPTPFTTKEPVTGICLFEGVSIQFVEIPSFFLKRHMTLAHASDVLLLLDAESKSTEDMDKILREHKLENKKKIPWRFDDKNYQQLLREIIKVSGFIRVFTKPVGKPVEDKAVVMKPNSTVKDLIERINKSWLKTFKFARIFDNTNFSGRKVGLDYVLKDNDIVELHKS